jgi:hypothetical protein
MNKDVHVFMFMGQSNMAGRGVAGLAPKVPEGWAYEYRAITRPEELVHVEEPFGVDENNPEGVDDAALKTGSMTAAFVNAAYPILQNPLICVSCSKGGSRIDQWQPGMPYYTDALMRLEKCRAFLAANSYRVLGTHMLWCQGCTDGDHGMTEEEYVANGARCILSFLHDGAVDRCYLIQTGNNRDKPLLYRPIQDAQERLCAENGRIVMVSRCLKTMASRGLMKDQFLYLQPAYNEMGTESGENTARCIIQK